MAQTKQVEALFIYVYKYFINEVHMFHFHFVIDIFDDNYFWFIFILFLGWVRRFVYQLITKLQYVYNMNILSMFYV